MVYESNLKEIELHNYLFEKGERSFALGENAYSDMVCNIFFISRASFEIRILSSAGASGIRDDNERLQNANEQRNKHRWWHVFIASGRIHSS